MSEETVNGKSAASAIPTASKLTLIAVYVYITEHCSILNDILSRKDQTAAQHLTKLIIF